MRWLFNHILAVIVVCISSGVLFAQERRTDSFRVLLPVAAADSARRVLSAAAVDSVRMLLPAKVADVRPRGTSPNRRFAAGTRARLFSGEELQPFKYQNLSIYLLQNSAVYMKEFGAGMGAYISIRGTSASHTSVYWNGMSVEMPTMGQTNFSHLPLFFFDAMELHLGGGSALYGNGSIGGSVRLETRPLWDSGLHGHISLSVGSFDRYMAGATLRYGKSGWESRTSALYAVAQNRFRFTNNTVAGKPKERQQHASHNNWGVLQELYKKMGASGELSFHLWVMEFDRSVQPSVSNNNRPETWTSLYDRNVKFSGAYRGNIDRFKYSAQASYARDYEQYKANVTLADRANVTLADTHRDASLLGSRADVIEADRANVTLADTHRDASLLGSRANVIEADRITGAIDVEYGFRRFTAKGGGSVAYVSPTGKAFDAATREWRSDLFGLLLWSATPSLIANVGIRNSFVSNLSLSPSPFVGAQWVFLHNDSYRLSLRGAFSQSFKVPTLNDRYWGGSHLYLRPERSTTWESGIDYEAQSRGWRWAVNGTGYFSHVLDWIRWFPAGVVWRPQNIPVVDASGIETSLRVNGAVGGVQLGLNGHYAYTAVTVTKSLWSSDPGVRYQLAYQPYHCFSAVVSGSYRFLSWEVQSRYTGARTTSDIHDVLRGYPQWNLRIACTGNLGAHTGTLQLMVNNIFDKDYQNVKFYAMPGRNFMLTMQFQF